MITDEQIADTFHKHGCYIDADMSAMRAVRELIALAQQVKPLEFVECSIQYRDLPVAYLKAETPLGNYTIHKYKYFGDQFATNYFYTGPGNGGKAVAAEATAIEAAQQDYARRVKSGLKYGGGE